MAIWQPRIARQRDFPKTSTRRASMSPALHGEFSKLLNLFALDETYPPNGTGSGEIAK
jgi:hypothetical protein